MRITSYFGVNATFNFARALPQAVLTPILIAKGLTYDSILWTQLVFMVVLSLCEFPAGALADRVSRKLLYLLAILALAASYTLVWIGTGLAVMCLAWSLYAVSSALAGSTFDIHYATALRDDQAGFRRFFSLNRNVVLASTIASALSTSLLYPWLGVNVYLVSLALFVLAVLAGAVLLPRTPIARKQIDGAPPKILHALAQDRRLLLICALVAVSQLALMPYFQLWQMVFLDNAVPAAAFGLIFIGFQVMNIVANTVWKRLPRTLPLAPFILGVCAIGVALLAVRGPWTVLVIGLLPLPLFLYINSLEFSMQLRAPAELLSSLNAMMGASGTFGGLIALALSLAGLQVMAPQLLLTVTILSFGALSLALLFACDRVFGVDRGRPA